MSSKALLADLLQTSEKQQFVAEQILAEIRKLSVALNKLTNAVICSNAFLSQMARRLKPNDDSTEYSSSDVDSDRDKGMGCERNIPVERRRRVVLRWRY